MDGVYLRIFVHANEHMGQLVASARLNGIPPMVANPEIGILRTIDFSPVATWEQTLRLPGRHNHAFPAPAEATVTCKDHKTVIDLFRRGAW
jgi:hypothetical protein